MPSLFSFLIPVIVAAIIAWCSLNIVPARERQDEWPSNLWEMFSSSQNPQRVGIKRNLAEKKSIFNRENKTFEYGRFHHGGKTDERMTTKVFEAIDFSLPLESFNSNNLGSAVLQKMSSLKEWSFTAFTDGEEWFCGTALSTVQLASGLMVYCYNAKTGRAFHMDDQSVAGNFFGWGTRFGRNQPEEDSNDGRTPYANNGYLEWDMGRIHSEHVAWARHGYNASTKQYEVRARVVAHEYVLDEATEYKSLAKDFPVLIEFEVSFPLVSTSEVATEGMTIVYPLSDSAETHRVLISSKFSGIEAKVNKFSITKKTGGASPGAPLYETIFDSNNHNKKNNFVAHLDWTRSQFPRHTIWKWVCFATTVTSKKANIISASQDHKQMQRQQQQEQNQVECIQTRIGLQLTGLSYRGPSKFGKNYSMESSLWINGSIFTIDAEVEFALDDSQLLRSNEQEGRDGREKMKKKLGRIYKVTFDTTKNYLIDDSDSGSDEKEKDFWKLEMTFVRKGAHVQDFGEFAPLHFGSLDHQWGDYTGELTHFVPSSKQKNALQLNHIYRFADVPGILEDHDTWW